MTKWKETCFFILRQLYTAKSQKCWPWSTLRSVGLWTPMLAAGHTNTSAEKCHSRYLTQTSKAVIPLLSSQRARKSHFPNRPIPSLQGNLLCKVTCLGSPGRAAGALCGSWSSVGESPQEYQPAGGEGAQPAAGSHCLPGVAETVCLCQT